MGMEGVGVNMQEEVFQKRGTFRVVGVAGAKLGSPFCEASILSQSRSPTFADVTEVEQILYLYVRFGTTAP